MEENTPLWNSQERSASEIAVVELRIEINRVVILIKNM